MVVPNKEKTINKLFSRISEKQNKVFIGIDVSKGTLDISINGKHYKIENKTSAINEFINSGIIPLHVDLCVLESTGGYERLVMRMLKKQYSYSQSSSLSCSFICKSN